MANMDLGIFLEIDREDNKLSLEFLKKREEYRVTIYTSDTFGEDTCKKNIPRITTKTFHFETCSIGKLLVC